MCAWCSMWWPCESLNNISTQVTFVGNLTWGHSSWYLKTFHTMDYNHQYDPILHVWLSGCNQQVDNGRPAFRSEYLLIICRYSLCLIISCLYLSVHADPIISPQLMISPFVFSACVALCLSRKIGLHERIICDLNAFILYSPSGAGTKQVQTSQYEGILILWVGYLHALLSPIRWISSDAIINEIGHLEISVFQWDQWARTITSHSNLGYSINIGVQK